MTSTILEELTKRKKVYMIPGKLFDDIFIRFVVNSPATLDDIKNSAQEVIIATDIVMARLEEENSTLTDDSAVKVETAVKPKTAIKITSFSKIEKVENCANFCTPRPNIVNVARS